MAFDIRQLRYAVAAADHGSFYKAARAMGVEQSTLSRNILKLERSVGAPIFERSRAGVTATLAGSTFLPGARSIVENADKLIAMMRAAGQGRAGGLRVGHNSSVSAGHLRATMMSWSQAHPAVEVECVEADRSVLLAGLDTGEIDIAILMGTLSHDGFRCEALWSERVLVALPTASPLAEREVVHWTDLRNERFLLPAADPGSEIRDMLLGRLPASASKPDIRIHQSSRETILSILGGGRGITIVCEGATGARYPAVVYRPIHGEQGPALIGYSGYWRDDNRNPALRRFLEFIKARYALAFDFSQRFQYIIGPILGEAAMVQGKTIIILLVTLVIGFAGGFVLRPVIAPMQQAETTAAGPPAALVTREARGTQYFVAHIDEARQVVAGCRDGSVRGGECATAEEAIIKVEAQERRKRFLGN